MICTSVFNFIFGMISRAELHAKYKLGQLQGYYENIIIPIISTKRMKVRRQIQSESNFYAASGMPKRSHIQKETNGTAIYGTARLEDILNHAKLNI